MRKKIFYIGIIISLLFLSQLEKTGASTLRKTVEFFIGQDNIVRSSAEQVNFYFNITIPESPAIQSAIIEISGISYSSSDQTINADLQQGVNPVGAGTDYIIGGTTKARPFNLLYDAFPAISVISASGSYDYTLYIKGTATASQFSIYSAKLVLTYDYSSTETSVLKTIQFLALQDQEKTADGAIVSRDFTITIPEQNPVIYSVFVETEGIAKGSNPGTIGVSLVKKGNPSNFTYYGVDLSPSASISRFTVRHPSSEVLSSDFPGSKDYTLNLKGTGFSTNLWKAKVYVTYKSDQGGSGLPIMGYAVSSTIDTGIEKGAAFNSMMWKGSLNGGKTKLQIATSGCPGGQTDYPACLSGNWDFYGPSCTNNPNDTYEVAPNTTIEIKCASVHNNKRYFRYKTILCSNDCVSSGSGNPTLTDFMLNWSP